MRFTQSAAASFNEDSLTRFHEARSIIPTALAAASWDYATVQQASAQPQGEQGDQAGPSLTLRDQPGAYAHEDAAQA